MIGQSIRQFVASTVVALCLMLSLSGTAHAQVNNPTDCPAFNRNWQCTGFGLNPAPFTTCVEVVRGGVVIDQRDRTFNGEAAFNAFLASAPAGTQYLQCGALPSCTQTTETQTLACPSGQTGSITQTRTVNTGGVCGATSAWTETSNTCRVPPSTLCVNPFGGTLQVGQSITAYATATTPYGTVCLSQTRTCQSDGTLTGSYTFQTCSVTPPQTCALPWGGAIANGQSVTAYATQTTPYGTICLSETRTCNNGVLSGSYTFQTCSVNPPSTCTLPWGGTIADGASVTAYRHVTITQAATTNTSATIINSMCAIARTSHLYVTAGTCSDIPVGTTDPTGNGTSTSTYDFCLSETRTCHNGVLSGSYTEQTCSASPSCTQTTETRTNGQQCPTGQTGVITETRTVNTGGVCGSYGAWTVTSNTCQAPQTCVLPWGGIIANGQSVTAYLASNVNYGGTCFFETRTCTNGVLSGSYTAQTCVISPPSTCALPWGGTLANGQSVTAYNYNASTNTCSSETRVCNNGSLSGSYTAQTCNVTPPQTCTLPWGGTLANGQSVTAYSTATTAYGTVCQSQTRTCTNGTLSGSYTFQTCSVNPPSVCTTPWGTTVANGQSITAYKTATTAYGTVCQSETRTCSNGTLSGSFTFQTCSVNQAQGCTLPNGSTIANGQSVIYYQSGNPAEGTACAGQTRTCTNGVLSGSYTAQTCTQVICTYAQAGDTIAKACTTTNYGGGTQTGSSTSTSYSNSNSSSNGNSSGGNSQSQAQSQSQSVNTSINTSTEVAQAINSNVNISGNGNNTVTITPTQNVSVANENNVNVNQSQSQAQAQNIGSGSAMATANAMLQAMMGY